MSFSGDLLQNLRYFRFNLIKFTLRINLRMFSGDFEFTVRLPIGITGFFSVLNWSCVLYFYLWIVFKGFVPWQSLQHLLASINVFFYRLLDFISNLNFKLEEILQGTLRNLNLSARKPQETFSKLCFSIQHKQITLISFNFSKNKKPTI